MRISFVVKRKNEEIKYLKGFKFNYLLLPPPPPLDPIDDDEGLE